MDLSAVRPSAQDAYPARDKPRMCVLSVERTPEFSPARHGLRENLQAASLLLRKRIRRRRRKLIRRRHRRLKSMSSKQNIETIAAAEVAESGM